VSFPNRRPRFLVLLLMTIAFLPVLSQAQEIDIFRDNFESYAVGTFPSAGGWEIVWDGMGAEYQVISTSYSYSPTKSFQLWGRNYWTAVVQRKFSTDAPVIGYELSILIEERGSRHGDHPAFFCREAAEWGAYYGTVLFDHSDGKIKAEDGRVLGTWSPKTWYRVKVILDRRTNTYSVWINGELKGKDIPTSRSDTNKINAIALVAGWHEKKVHYDDVRVFIVAKAPDLTIVPASVKFSPSSVPQGGVITVTWTEKNQGNGDAGPYTVGVYLATTEYGTNYLLGRISRSGLNAGESFTDTRSFRVPDKIPPGQYFVTVFIDDSFQVKESNENNNIGSSNPNKVNVEPPMRAARIVSLSTERETYCMDETVKIPFTINNTGNVKLHLRVVLEVKDPSGKTIYDSHQVGQDKEYWLDPGQQIYDYFSWKIPRTAPPGVYKVLVSVRDWDDWNMIYDYRWGDKPGLEFKVYALRVRLDSITLNDQTLSTNNPELRVTPGARITGTVTFTVENVQPGSWITPVIWVTSWERGTVADGKVRVVSNTIWSTQQFTVKIDVVAPEEPGTYYIGFFAGWMYSPDEVASNDHPPKYGDGDDIWDMKLSDWESILREGRTPEGAIYGWPGRAIRIVVEKPSPQLAPIVNIFTLRGLPENNQLSPGQSITPVVRVKNYGTSNIRVKIRVVIDRDHKEPYDYDRSIETTVAPGGEKEVTLPPFTPSEPGKYYSYAMVYAYYTSQPVLTDQYWGSEFFVQPQYTTVKVTVQAIDGFGVVRNDWPVVIENVASGMGQVDAELVEGQQYVARVTALGYTNTTTFVAQGPQMVIRVKIPTAKIEAQVVDGFGEVMRDEIVEIIGVASGQVTVSRFVPSWFGPVEVLGGQQYVVKTVVFGKEFSQTVNVPVGQIVTVQLQVPTARLSITVVDDVEKPIDKYVSSVELTGPLNLMFYSAPPKDIKVLAGTYNITVIALGKKASASVTLNAGETKSIQIVVPGTAGLDFMGARIPLLTLVPWVLALVVVAVAAVTLIVRRRGRTDTIEHIGDETRTRVMRF